MQNSSRKAQQTEAAPAATAAGRQAGRTAELGEGEPEAQTTDRDSHFCKTGFLRHPRPSVRRNAREGKKSHPSHMG